MKLATAALRLFMSRSIVGIPKRWSCCWALVLLSMRRTGGGVCLCIVSLENRDIWGVSALLAASAKADVTGEDGLTPIRFASDHGHRDVVAA